MAPVAAIIEARMGSSRLPGKVLADLGGRPALARVVERLQRSKRLDAVMIATTTDPSDQPIADLGAQLGVPVFRGSMDDVLGRVLGAAVRVQADTIVEITGDCPLIDPEVVDRVVGAYLAGSHDLVTNVRPWSYPQGMDTQVMALGALERAAAAIAGLDQEAARHYREHVTLYLHDHPDQFRIGRVAAPPEQTAPALRLLLDHPEDLEVLRGVYQALAPGKPDFRLGDILALAAAQPDLFAANRHLQSPWVLQGGMVNPQKVRRAAVIGCGRAGSLFDEGPIGLTLLSHAGAYAADPRATLAAAADPDPGKRAAFGERWGVSALYDSPAALLRAEAPEIVSICTPTATHSQVAAVAVEAGVKAILCEKPLASTVAEGKRMVDLCRTAGVVLAVNHQRRWDPDLIRVQEYLAQGSLGAPQRVHATYTRGIVNNGTHLIDLLRWYFGEMKTAVRLDLGPTPDRAPGPDGDPTVDARLTPAAGFPIVLEGLDGAAYSAMDVDMYFRHGRILLARGGAVVEHYRAQDSPLYPGFKELVKTDALIRQPDRIMGFVAADLIECLETGRAPRCTGEDGLRALEIALALAKEF